MGRMKDALQRLRLGLLRRVIGRAEAAGAAKAIPPWPVRGLVRKHEDRFFGAMVGALSFELLRTGYRVGLFKILHRKPGLSQAEIARELGFSPYSVEILLLGLVPLGIVEKVGDRYYNDPFLSGALAEKTLGDMPGQVLAYFHHVLNPAAAHLETAVREGRPAALHALFGPETPSFYGALPEQPEVNRFFEAAMRADTGFNRDRVARSRAFEGCRRILDVGGNTGELAMAIARAHPAAHVTVFDFDAVLERTRARFRAAAEETETRLAEGVETGLAGRLDTLGGDILNEGFPKGYDCVLFAHFLDIFSRERVRSFLQSAYDCLPPGGRAVVFGTVVHDDEQGPLAHGVLSAYFCFLADGEGRFYTAAQTEEAMRAVGFARVTRQTLPKDEMLIIGVKGAGG